jgi:hypothetical protein
VRASAVSDSTALLHSDRALLRNLTRAGKF